LAPAIRTRYSCLTLVTPAFQTHLVVCVLRRTPRRVRGEIGGLGCEAVLVMTALSSIPT